MTEQNEKQKTSQGPSSFYGSVPKPAKWVLLVAVLVSLAVHITSFIPLSYIAAKRTAMRPNANIIKFHTTSIDPKKLKPLEPDKEVDKTPPDVKKLVETPMRPTKPPTNAPRLGAQDHQTDHETKLKKLDNDLNTADAGAKGKPNGGAEKEVPDSAVKAKTETDKPQKPNAAEMALTPDLKPSVKPRLDFNGKIPMIEQPKPRNAYESLMPSSKELYGQVNAGYKEYVDDNVDEGDRIDLNTAEYKYISYFTKIRKAINLVWVYPTEAARRGMSGEVQVEWTIMKDGSIKRVRVIKSSGYDILDDAIVNALKLASPFPNLPVAWKVERKVIVGSFKYILTDYAGAH